VTFLQRHRGLENGWVLFGVFFLDGGEEGGWGFAIPKSLLSRPVRVATQVQGAAALSLHQVSIRSPSGLHQVSIRSPSGLHQVLCPIRVPVVGYDAIVRGYEQKSIEQNQ